MKNSPFAKRKPRAKRIFDHALSRESKALSAQPLLLRLIWPTKLAQAELSQFQFDLNSAKRRPNH